MKDKIIFSIWLFLFVYTGLVVFNTELREPFWLLPFAYLFLFSVCKHNRNALGKSPGNICLNIILLLRYVTLPLVTLKTNVYEGFAKDYSHIYDGIYLMLFELFAVFITNELFLSKYKQDAHNKELHSYSFRRTHAAFFFSLILLVIFACLNPSLYQGAALITQGFLDQNDANMDRSTFVSLLWQSLTTWVYVYFVLLQRHKYDRNGNKKYVHFSIIVTLFFLLITFIGQSEISRWYSIINAIAGIYVLIKLFSKEKRLILLVILTPFILVLFVVTIYKNVSIDSDVDAEAATTLMTSLFLNAYLAGPVSTNNAIGLYETGKVGLHNLPNDIVANMPIVNHFFSDENTLNYMYNDYIGRAGGESNGDQIIPLIGQGLCYFGPVLSIILSILAVFLSCYSDVLFHKSSSPYMFIFAFLAAWFGVEMCLNMTINLSWIYIRVLPMFLFFFFAEKIKI